MDTDLTPTSTKSPDDTESDTPPHTTQLIKPLSSLKNHHHHNCDRRDDEPKPPPALVVIYKECMKNHAAAIGGHAVDGCGEFMPSPSSTCTDPTSLACAACGCHRNFHRRDPESPTFAIIPQFLDFRHPLLPKQFSLSPSPPSPPPPPPPAPYPPHVFFRLSSAAVEDHHQAPVTPTVENPVGRKRFRTKFNQEQKEKMYSFSVKLGWKMQKSNEAAVKAFCHEIGISKGVLKVWMHNNKNTFGKKEINSGSITNDRPISFVNNGGGGSGGRNSEEKKIDNGKNFQNECGNEVHFNGSSSTPA